MNEIINKIIERRVNDKELFIMRDEELLPSSFEETLEVFDFLNYSSGNLKLQESRVFLNNQNKVVLENKNESCFLNRRALGDLFCLVGMSTNTIAKLEGDTEECRSLAINYLDAYLKKTGHLRPVQIIKKNNGANDGTIISIPSESYTMIDHRVMVDAISKNPNMVLRRARIWDNKLQLDTVSKREHIFTKKEEGDIVQVGISYFNSMDRTTSIQMNSFLYRLVCSNGAIASIPEFMYRERHVGGSRLRFFVNNNLDRLLEKTEVFIKALPKLNDRIVLADEMKKIKIEAKEYGKDVVEVLSKKQYEGMRAMELFNDVTEYAHHRFHNYDKQRDLEQFGFDIVYRFSRN